MDTIIYDFVLCLAGVSTGTVCYQEIGLMIPRQLMIVVLKLHLDNSVTKNIHNYMNQN